MDNKEIKLDLSLREEEKEPLTQKEVKKLFAY